MNLTRLVFSIALAALIAPRIDLLAEESRQSVSIGFGSCYSEQRAELWDVLRKQNLDAFLFLGDNIYLPNSWEIDRSTFDAYYRELFHTPSFQQFLRSTYEIPIWDDHDFGPNNGDSTFADKGVALDAFRRYWEIPAEKMAHPNGLYRTAAVGPVKLILTDNRSFRMDRVPKEERVIFGDTQMEWIERELAASGEHSIILFVTGHQLLTSGPKHEHLAQYPREHGRLLRAIKDAPKPVIIVSGDRHFGDIIDRRIFDHRFVEATSSPMSGRTAKPKIVWPQIGRRRVLLGSPNFGKLNIDSSSSKIEVLIELVSSEDGEVLRRYRIVH